MGQSESKPIGGGGAVPYRSASRGDAPDALDILAMNATRDSSFWARTNLAMSMPFRQGEPEENRSNPSNHPEIKSERTPLMPRMPQRLKGSWYSPLLEATPMLITLDLVFTAFMFLWSLATPTNDVLVGHHWIAALCCIPLLIAIVCTIRYRSLNWFFFAMSIGFGSLIGHSYYCSHFIQLWSYDNKAGYVGVHAASPAKSKSSAGSFAFTKTTHVDVTQPIGYKRGDVYCVAPIIDDAISDVTVNFWAVGLNCCGARDAFRCYDSLEPQARGGMVVATERESDFHADPLEMYKKAAEIASARYDLKQSPDVMFVYWIHDLAGERTRIEYEAYSRFGAAALIFLVVLLPTFGLFKVTYDRAMKKNEDKQKLASQKNAYLSSRQR